MLLVMLCAMDVLCVVFFEVAGNTFRSHADSWKLRRMYISGFRSYRPERFPVQNGRRVPARRKGGTSGMFRPDSAGIRPEQESCPGFRHPKNRNESRNVQASRKLYLDVTSCDLLEFLLTSCDLLGHYRKKNYAFAKCTVHRCLHNVGTIRRFS